jgi:hypothetical protein
MIFGVTIKILTMWERDTLSVCENTNIHLFTSLSCCVIIIFIKTINLKIKYIYSNNSHCIGCPQQHVGTPLV